MKLSIDGRDVRAEAGQNLLDAALAAGIDIPHLCHDIKLSPGANCGLCLVSVNGNPPVKACETMVEADLQVRTDSPQIADQRREALAELLAVHRGDCIAPCKLACPADVDCQGYAGLIAEGFYDEALRLLKESYPLPASVGRVCPHPCEDACRRSLFEGPVALTALKRFAGDLDLKKDQPYLPDTAEPSGKKAAVIGAGPAGLTAAWKLAIAGHAVTVLEAMPKAGGMLRYGIPEFRLPKAILDQEIAIMEAIGIEIRCNEKVTAVRFADVKAEYDAVLLSVGAWQNAPLNIPGDDLPHVMSGLALLRDTALGRPPGLGGHVAVVGGGNTAIDAARTAIRLPGVDKVSLIYRRTREQMPAFADEVSEAEMEGVEFCFLENPVSISADGGGLRVRVQLMELGSEDASGRRRPVPVEGQFKEFFCDSLVAAIGQKTEADLPGNPALNRWGYIETAGDASTSLAGVFAAGDAINEGPGMVVDALGHGQTAAAAIDAWLQGRTFVPITPSYAAQSDLTAADFAHASAGLRQKQPELTAAERRKNFRESTGGFTAEQAQAESVRCLECGCLDVYECKLLQYAGEFGMIFPNDPALPHEEVDRRQPYLYRDPNKCISCGLCVRVCKEIMGYGCWEMDESGDRPVVRIKDNLTLPQAYCISCGQCVEHCPVGALTERNPRLRAVPLQPEIKESVCNYCGVACSTNVHHYGDKPLKVTPAYGGSLDANVLCAHGRYGWHTAMGDRDLHAPMLRIDGALCPVGWDEAYGTALAGLKRIQAEHGDDAVGVLIADRMTNEEIYQALRLADAIGTRSIYSANIYDGGLEDVFGFDCSTNTYQELAETDCILVIGADVPSYYAMLALPVQQAKYGRGAKLLVAAADGWNGFNYVADRRAVMEDDTRFVKEMLKDCIDSGLMPKNAAGFAELKASLRDVIPGEEAKAFARDYRESETAMIMIDRERISRETARLVSALAVVCDKIGRPHTGIIQMLQHNTTQSVSLMKIRTNMEALQSDIHGGKIKGMVLVEQFIPDEEAVRRLEYTVLLDSARGPALAAADVFLPMPGFGSYQGTYLSGEGRVQPVNRIFSIPSGKDGWQVLDELTAWFGGTALHTLEAVQESLADRFPVFRAALLKGKTFVGDGPVRYQEGFATSDGKAHLYPAAEKAPAFADMCFADVPLTVWFGQLIQEGVLNID